MLVGALPVTGALWTAYDLLGVGVFLVGLFWLSLAADRAGLISVLGNRLLGFADGDGRLLLVMIVLLATAATAMFSNDGAVVLVTPVVIQLCRRLNVDPLPHVFAVTFVADTASSIVPVANPVNILFAERLDLSSRTHVAYLAIPTLAALAVTTLMLLVVMRDRVPRQMSGRAPEQAPPAVLDRMGRLVGICLLATAGGYVASAFFGFSPYWITLCGGVLALTPGLAGRRVRARELVKVQPPGLYAFVVGLAVIVAAVEHQGMLERAGLLVLELRDQSDLAGILGIGFGAAIGSNLINNWTMALVLIPSLESSNASAPLIFAGLFGTDIGPNLTIVGSLATLIWMTQVRRAGLEISAWTYLRLGLLTTVPALLVAMVTLFVIGSIA